MLENAVAEAEKPSLFEAGAEAHSRKDYSEAMKQWTAAAEAGDTDASYNLGLMHGNGFGVDQDFEKALTYFSGAAEAGHAESEYSLGVIYDVRFSDEPDKAEAAYWYTKAADQGHAQAQCNLAGLYEAGTGVSRDYLKAVELYGKSAEQGYPVAFHNLAVMCENGTGMDQDYPRAAELYEMAASYDLGPAQYNLGVMYAKGLGVAQDVERAKDLVQRGRQQRARSRAPEPYRARGPGEERNPVVPGAALPRRLISILSGARSSPARPPLPCHCWPIHCRRAPSNGESRVSSPCIVSRRVWHLRSPMRRRPDQAGSRSCRTRPPPARAAAAVSPTFSA